MKPLFFALLILACMAVFCVSACYGQMTSQFRNVTETKANAARGDAQAQCDLGTIYFFGIDVPEDVVESAKWYRKAAEQGYARAQGELAGFYIIGSGVPQDFKEAMKWYHKAAEQGDVKAQVELGSCYIGGFVAPQNAVEAVKWYRKAAEQGDARGQIELGDCYASGIGVSQNLSEAYKWFNLAAAMEDEWATWAAEKQTDLSKRMTPAQIAEAQKLSDEWKPKVAASTGLTESLAEIQVKAEQGDAESQYRLALRYEEGKGVPKDVMEAAKWHHKAAEQGHVGGQVRLAHFYHIGYGRPKDMVEAYKWYNLAASHGSITLSKMRDIMASKMTPEQVAEAQKLSREWRPKTTK